MSKIRKEFIEDNAVDGSKVRLDNNQSLKARNNANNADVEIVKVNASDVIEFINQPQYGVDPSADNDLARKKYVDDQIAAVPAVPPIFEIKGNWNGTTNIPALDNTDTSVDGFLYYVNVAGSVDFGAGSIAFSIGDWVYNVNGAWEKADNNDDVLSVAGKTGVVTLDTDDVTEAANLYFTAARAKSAAVADAIVDAVTDVAPSQNAVFDALALKLDVSAKYTNAEAQAAAVADSITDGVTDVAPSQNAVFDALALKADASASNTPGREVITITAQNITDSWFEISQPAIANSLQVIPVGGPAQEPGVDYSESIVVTNTRVTLLGDLLSLVATNKVIVYYQY
jgi:hypothetical protein